MTDSIRAALEKAAHELDIAENALLCSSFHNAASRAKQAAMTARAALSQPEPAGLSDEELMELMPQQFRDDLATVSRMAAHGAGPDVGAGLFRVSLNTGALEFARAAIAADRAQRQPVPPEPKGPTHRITPDDFRRWWRETGSANPAPSPEMLLTANAWAQYCLSRWGRPAPQPVPVSERPWEREGWCDEQGKCWWFNPGQPAMSNPHIATSSWRLCRMLNGKPMGAYSLPAHALPLPVEVES